MKRALEAWKWSLAVIVRSLVSWVALAALSALWAFGGYKWLWLPESSAHGLLFSQDWALAQILVAVAVLAGTAAAAFDAVRDEGPPMGGMVFITFQRKLIGQALLLVLGVTPLIVVVTMLFAWLNVHALEVASFLTFHLEKPVSHVVIEKVFWTIEALIWIALAGFLLTSLIIGLRAGWSESWRRAGRTLLNCCFRAPFLSGLLSVGVTGGVTTLLANWHPLVFPGFWDYTQLTIRIVSCVLLLSLGWLFWILSLARLSHVGNVNQP
jgi:hypothetical protein